MLRRTIPRDWRLVVRALTTVLAVATSGCGPSEPRPHLFLITSDALRADHLSLNGYARATSPNLDAFAETAWHFPEFVTPIAKTNPSFATIFTGMHPFEHGVGANSYALPKKTPLLAEALRAAGYRTAAFVSNPNLSKRQGFDRGFEEYGLLPKSDGVLRANRALLRWARGHDWSEPTFVWLHYIDPHGPYTPPARFEQLFAEDEVARADERTVALQYEPLRGFPENFVLGAIPKYQQVDGDHRLSAYVSRYDAEIRFMDTAFGTVLEFLKERGLFEDAAVVFTSDHGESLTEHNYYFEHGWYAYEATLRIPLLIKEPKQTVGGRVEGLATTLDCFPTLLALAGLAAPETLGGRNLLARPGAASDVLIENTFTYPERYVGVRTGRWKYIAALTGSLLAENPLDHLAGEELYDLARDSAEAENLAKLESERLDEIRRLFEERYAAMKVRARSGLEKIGPMDRPTREHLEALGYAQ